MDAQQIVRWHPIEHHFKDSVARLEHFFLPGRRNFLNALMCFSLFVWCGLTDAIELGDIKLRSILTSVHQGHQQLVRSAQFGSAKVSQACFDHFQHLFKGLSFCTPVSRLKSGSFSCSIVSYRMCLLWHAYARGLLTNIKQ